MCSLSAFSGHGKLWRSVCFNALCLLWQKLFWGALTACELKKSCPHGAHACGTKIPPLKQNALSHLSSRSHWSNIKYSFCQYTYHFHPWVNGSWLLEDLWQLYLSVQIALYKVNQAKKNKGWCTCLVQANIVALSEFTSKYGMALMTSVLNKG